MEKTLGKCLSSVETIKCRDFYFFLIFFYILRKNHNCDNQLIQIAKSCVLFNEEVVNRFYHDTDLLNELVTNTKFR